MTVSSDEAFTKQRRNLVITSFVIIIYLMGELKLDRVIIQGAVFDIGNKKIILQAMWMLQVYFLWRYWAVFRGSSHWNKFSQRGWEYLKGKTSGSALKKIRAEIKKIYQGNDLQNVLDSVVFEVNDHPVNNWVSWTYKFSYQIKGVPVKRIYVFKGWDLIIKRITCGWYLFMNTDAVSEYIFPFFLALLAVLELCGFKIVESIFAFLSGYKSWFHYLSKGG